MLDDGVHFIGFRGPIDLQPSDITVVIHSATLSRRLSLSPFFFLLFRFNNLDVKRECQDSSNSGQLIQL